MNSYQKNYKREGGYLALAEAIILDGVAEYVTAAKRLQKNDFKGHEWRVSSVHMYLKGKHFILCGCNGIMESGGKKLLSDVNKKNGLDVDAIEENVAKILTHTTRDFKGERYES